MKKKYKIPKIKKDIKYFLLSEEGKITKKDIAKIGLSLGVLGMMFTPTQVAAHNNYFFSGYGQSGSAARGGHVSHSSHGSHSSQVVSYLPEKRFKC